jgi:hypothetical protein
MNLSELIANIATLSSDPPINPPPYHGGDLINPDRKPSGEVQLPWQQGLFLFFLLQQPA